MFSYIYPYMIISLQIWGLQDDFNGGKQSGISWCDLPEKDYIRCDVLVSLWRALKESIAYLLRMILKIWIIEIFVQKKKYETVCYRPAKCKTVYLRPSCKETRIHIAICSFGKLRNATHAAHACWMYKETTNFWILQNLCGLIQLLKTS